MATETTVEPRPGPILSKCCEEAFHSTTFTADTPPMRSKLPPITRSPV
jgi:hypothetical protein